jgi:hypothetical protein
VFGLSSNDVFASFLVKVCSTFNAEIVGFSGSTCKDDFLGGSANQIGDLFAGSFRDLFGFPTKGMCPRMGISIRTNL